MSPDPPKPSPRAPGPTTTSCPRARCLAASIYTTTGCVYTGSVTTVASVVNSAAAAAMSARCLMVLNMVGNMLRLDHRHRTQALGYHLGQSVLILT